MFLKQLKLKEINLPYIYVCQCVNIYIYIYIYLGGIIIVNTTLIELKKKDMLVKVVTDSMNLDNIEW